MGDLFLVQILESSFGKKKEKKRLGILSGAGVSQSKVKSRFRVNADCVSISQQTLLFMAETNWLQEKKKKVFQPLIYPAE